MYAVYNKYVKCAPFKCIFASHHRHHQKKRADINLNAVFNFKKYQFSKCDLRPSSFYAVSRMKNDKIDTFSKKKNKSKSIFCNEINKFKMYQLKRC